RRMVFLNSCHCCLWIITWECLNSCSTRLSSGVDGVAGQRSRCIIKRRRAYPKSSEKDVSGLAVSSDRSRNEVSNVCAVQYIVWCCIWYRVVVSDRMKETSTSLPQSSYSKPN
ncbi:hypothetical protein F4678DRAFT_426026, partial [Xylaria arbuscula]